MKEYMKAHLPKLGNWLSVKWAISSNQRSMAVSEMQKIVEMDQVEQPAAQLTKRRIDRDNHDRKNLRATILNNCNPFEGPVTESNSLHNIASGRAASE